MCTFGFFLLAGLLLGAGAIPQDFSDLFAVYAPNLNTTGDQYYSVQYLGNSPESVLSRYNLTEADLKLDEVADIESEVDEYDDEVDQDMEQFFFENGFVVVNNDDIYDYSYKPKRPASVKLGLNASTAADDDSIDADKEPDANLFDEIMHDEGDSDDVEASESMVNQNQTIEITTTTSTTEAAPSESTTTTLEPNSTTEAIMNESTTAASGDGEDDFDLNHETNYENSELVSDLEDQVIPAFVHPIHRPSNLWPLNVTQIGNINQQLNRKPVRRRPVRRRRPMINRRPVKNRRRRPTTQNAIRRPANGLKKGNKRRRGPYRRKRPVRIPLQANNLNSVHRFFASRSCGTCQCGVTTTRRIVGGTIASINEFPWLALIAYNGSIQCGGTLISDRHVLTAAHCVRGFAAKDFQIRFLEYNRLESSETTLVVRKAAKIYTLDSYKANTADNDVGIIRLSAKIDFLNTTVRPICLPPSGMSFVGKTGTIAGWGTTTENGNLAKILRKATVPIISNPQCQLVGMKITKNMLCAGRLLTGGVDACQGDSGGPLMVVLNKRYYLAGVVSWGDGCARPKKPGVYARVTRYLQWIQRLSIGSCTCT